MKICVELLPLRGIIITNLTIAVAPKTQRKLLAEMKRLLCQITPASHGPDSYRVVYPLKKSVLSFSAAPAPSPYLTLLLLTNKNYW